MVPQEADQPVEIARPLEMKELQPVHSSVNLSPWEAVVEIGFVFFIFLAPMIARVLLSGEDVLDQAEKSGVSPYWSVAVNGSLALTMVWFILHKDRHSFKSLGLHFKNGWQEVVIAGLVLIGIYVLQGVIVLGIEKIHPEWMGPLVKRRGEMIGKFPLLSPRELLVFTLFVGFYEELLFRGFLISRLKIAMKSVWPAVIISSAIFAVVHSYQDWLAMIQIFIIALVLGGLFVLRGSLVSPILVHAGFDFISLMTAFYLVNLSPEKLKELMPRMCALVFGQG